MRLIFLYLICVTALTAGSRITLSDTLLNFGDVFTGDSLSLELIVGNTGDTELYLREIRDTEEVFSVTGQPVTINPGQNYAAVLKFKPIQNIAYDARLLLRIGEGNGDTTVHLLGNGRIKNSYYDASYNLWGTQLKQALHNIIKDHVEFPYSSSDTDVWDILRDTDEDPDNPNNVILLYTGWSYSKNNNGGDASEWNREHVWAKSHGNFGKNPPAGTDVHHLRPTDVTVNSTRGSLDFDNGGSLYTDGDGPTECRYDNDSWEPRDAVKGDVARMMYYMTVRYEGEEGYDLELVEQTGTSGPVFGRQSTLYAWHTADPPDDFERRRNDIIYTKYQKNRNPFIDFPAFADRLPSVSGVTDRHLEARLFAGTDSVVFPVTPANQTALYKIALINTGGGAAHVQSISTDGPFSVSLNTLTIQAESVRLLDVMFTGESGNGMYEGHITLNSDDSDSPEITLPLKVRVGLPAALDAAPVSAPRGLTVYGNYPNPFNPATRLRFYMPRSGALNLAVYNTQGRRVYGRFWDRLPPGNHNVNIHLENNAAGIYFYRLATTRETVSGKMVLLP